MPTRRSRLSAFFLLALLCSPLSLPAEPVVLHRQVEREPVSEGVELIRMRQFDTSGWLNVFALEIDHSRPHLALDALSGGDRLTGLQPLSKTARERGAIAAINGDFFHIQTTGAPVGAHIQSGEMFKSPPAGDRTLSAGIESGRPFIGPVLFEGRARSSTGAARALAGWNAQDVPPDGIVHYNRRWGATAPGPGDAETTERSGLVHAVLDHTGRVVRLLKGKAAPPIPEDGAVLLGRGEGAAWLLGNAQPGQRVETFHSLAPGGLDAAIGGFPLLLHEGEVVVEADPRSIHPRSAFAFNADKSRSWLVAVDGRSPSSRGVDLHELARILKDLGAHHALNLDGGGSTTLIARAPGAETPAVRNNTSDGRERDVPNGIGVFDTSPPGPLRRLHLQQSDPPNEYTREPAALRLAPGASRKFRAFGTDGRLNPVALPAPVVWGVSPAELGAFSRDGVFRAGKTGKGEITASLSTPGETFRASLPVRVIGKPVRLEAVPSEIILSPRQGVDLVVHAVDARGYRATLAADNVEWDVLGGMGEVSNGRFTAGETTGSGALAAKFGDLRGTIPVGIGDRPVVVASFDDEGTWWTHALPETVQATVSVANHLPFIRERPRATRLEYDLSGTSRTRAAYVRPPGGLLELPGRPLRLGLWLYGDGQNAWLRGQLVDGAGIAHSIDFARNVDWTGWRYLQAEIPPGLDLPLSLRSIYVVETQPDREYSGAVYFDEVLAVNAPNIDPSFLQEEDEAPDAANRPERLTAADEENFRFVVFGHSKVMAATPQSQEARVLAALIDEINREEIEFVLFTGDLAEHDAAEHYRPGKAFLDRLRAPCHVTVASHATAGSDNFQPFRDAFGPTYYHFSRGNSEFIVLNTARPGLRASEPEQWPWLQERLAASEAENLFLLTHTPVIDPMPGGKTGWSDQSEGRLFQRLLSREAEARSNVYAFHGHVQGFTRRAVEGVQYITSAGAGSLLQLPPAKAGFVHYTLIAVRGREVTYQVIPLLDRIEMAASLAARVGDVLELEAEGVTPESLVRFSLRYPAAVEWTVADPEIARIEDATGRLQALKPGETMVTVRSGRISASTRLQVAP